MDYSVTLSKVGGYQPFIQEMVNNGLWAKLCRKYDIPKHIWLPLLGYTELWAEHVYRYKNDTANHKNEATRIFLSTMYDYIKSIFVKNNSYFSIPVDKSTIYAQDDIQPQEIKENVFSSYWVGHATQIYTIPVRYNSEIRNFTILTDPVQGSLSFLYPRFTNEGAQVQDYPEINALIYSHNHRDHFDPETLRLLCESQLKLYNNSPIIFVPKGLGAMLNAMNFKNVFEMMPGDVAILGDFMKIASVDSRHWSGRCIHDSHTTAFHSVVIQSNAMNGCIYFAGDTALLSNEELDAITKCFDIAYSMQPGGPDDNRVDMESTHQSSADGLLMHVRFIKARTQDGTSYSFGELSELVKTLYMHTKTFKLGPLHFNDTDQSIHRVLNALQAIHSNSIDENDLAKDILSVLRPHEQVVVEEILAIASTITFRKDDGEVVHGIPAHDIVELLTHSVRIPKIGERTDLGEGIHELEMNLQPYSGGDDLLAC
ncbi:putative MBL fold metallo-hydrolase [Candidatus Cyrtobacter comes]|uniref:MBL fold metallo-hydrolase n=1 Tax=Candidatus Cyrtobacter comes TaxID=675776 RepID=A0ABU5L710_9RICK|nr:MBL fold metallo-hydrolase [Candidatus Cyrtobacter comes]MDZ5761910.1 putative MBL fold metallo-hydrolase [Candidatus Cyrtobacter comes]